MYACVNCWVKLKLILYDMNVNFRGDQIFMDFVRFQFYDVLASYICMVFKVRIYNICSAWFLDIRLSTCQ